MFEQLLYTIGARLQQDGQEQHPFIKRVFMLFSPFFTIFYAFVRMLVVPIVIFYITVYVGYKALTLSCCIQLEYLPHVI